MAAQAMTRLLEAETLLDNRRLNEARAAFEEAECAGAEVDRCSAGRWRIAMLGGDFEAAWRESDAIRGRGAPDPHRFWNGEPLHRACVIVRCLHGLGDTVQMMQYASRLRQIASHVTYQVAPRFLPVARFFRGVDHAISWDAETRHSPEWDIQVESTELPYIFRTTLDELPVAVEYLDLPRALLQSTAKKMGQSERPRIGYVWACGEWNPDRSIPLRSLEILLETCSVEHWSLQGGSASEQARERIGPGTMHDANAICGDGLVALASAIANLDLVITVDTLAAHLAGALGKPVWVLLHYSADWRWMTNRADSPWYPSMRLFRQPSAGDWRAVIDSVRNALDSDAFESVKCEPTRRCA